MCVTERVCMSVCVNYTYLNVFSYRVHPKLGLLSFNNCWLLTFWTNHIFNARSLILTNNPNSNTIALSVPSFFSVSFISLCHLCFISRTENPRESCFEPGLVRNGTRIGAELKLGSTVTYYCDSGYTLEGEAILTCVMGADSKPTWNKPKPVCIGTNAVSSEENVPLNFYTCIKWITKW